MPKCGIVYVAMGQRARAEARESAATARRVMDYPVVILSDGICPGFDTICLENSNTRGRAEKLGLPWSTPFEYTLYLDADTRVMQPMGDGFQILQQGFDLVLTQSVHQDEDAFWHVSDEERQYTLAICGYKPTQWQCGMFFFRREWAMPFFTVWTEEWLRFRGNDQAAFVRALHRHPLRLWTLGRAWNGGAILQHHFGRLS